MIGAAHVNFCMRDESLEASSIMKREGCAPSLTKIRVLGVGGGGVNALNRMIQQRFSGVEFVAINTDALSLARSLASTRIQIGTGLTRGLGTGGNAFLGKQAAYESADQLKQALQGADLLFLTAGMGGGTGTAVLPMLAEMAQEMGILTIAVLTKPFEFEGRVRQRTAEEGIRQLRQFVDTVLVIENERLLRMVGKGPSLDEALHVADGVLSHAIQAMSELATSSGLINIDFADVRMTLQKPGQALMAVGQAQGEERARLAVEQALSLPLLDTSLAGARDLLVNLTAGPDLTLGEIEQVMALVQEATASQPSVKFGAVFEEKMGPALRVAIVAKGLGENGMQRAGTEAENAPRKRPFTNTPMGQFLQPAWVRLRYANAF